MARLTWKSISERISKRRQRGVDSGLLRAAEFDYAAAAERMRVDRNGSPLAILLITQPDGGSRPEDTNRLAEFLGRRLRMTDTAGRLRDGRVGVLLPDTPAAGAWKVAEDLGNHYPAGSQRPAFEVMVYPDQPPRGGDEQDQDDQQGHGTGRLATPQYQHAAGIDAGVSAAESFFVRSSPVWKRGLDLLGASVGLLLAAPVIGAAAAAVMLSSRGGAFYTQQREGLGGRRFSIYKLRTMWHGADRLKDGLREYSEQDGPAFKMSKDPRVTPLGALLRSTSIDELPQLLNVLRGEMSLVGPRPLQIDESLACLPWQRRRLAVKPGLTCIWQVKGRNIVSFDEWIRMDLEYASRRSWWMDLALILKTPVSLLTTQGPR